MALASEFSAWVAIVAVPTMVAGIYGMNFDNMPELRWHHGYFVILGGMLLIMIALYLDFKRNKWL
jgi:magnesium transporter